MEVKDGKWYMSGTDHDDPNRIKDSDELLALIERVGFLPLFENDVPGFSVENMTDPSDWWCGDVDVDPWEWRIVLARTGKVAYGKFFGKRAGFISKKWFPHFANYRRDGYDFDSRYEDGKADYREKLIMDLMWPDSEICGIEPKNVRKLVSTPALFSYDIKDKAGFGKGGEKNFEGTCSRLQMEGYLIARDFKPKLNKSGGEYGWPIALYTLPEYLWGYKFVTSCYKDDPSDSFAKMVSQVMKFYDTSEAQVRKVLKR